jgi:hypothetical protein
MRVTRSLWLLPLTMGILLAAGCSAGTPATAPADGSNENKSIDSPGLVPGEEFVYFPGEEALGELPEGHQYAYRFNDETGKTSFLGVRAPDGTIADTVQWENPLAHSPSRPNAQRLAVEAKLEKLRSRQTAAEIQAVVESEKPAELMYDAETTQYVAGFLIELQAPS